MNSRQPMLFARAMIAIAMAAATALAVAPAQRAQARAGAVIGYPIGLAAASVSDATPGRRGRQPIASVELVTLLVVSGSGTYGHKTHWRHAGRPQARSKWHRFAHKLRAPAARWIIVVGDAQEPRAATPRLFVDPTSGPVGSIVTITGAGFGSGQVFFTWSGLPLAHFFSSGRFLLVANVPSGLPAGASQILVVNPSLGLRGSTAYTVTSGALPLSTATSTPVSPIATSTLVPPTATRTPAPQPPTATSTPAPPTRTPTPQPPTATSTPAPPTRTPTPQPPTATFTPAPPTATPTPQPPTATFTPAPPTATPIGLPIPTSGTTSNGCQITAASGQAEGQLLGLLNQHRAAAGVAALTWNAALSTVARTHSCDMFQHQQLSHTGSDGSSPFQRMAAAGFTMPPYSQEGENIGMASGMTPSGAVSAIDAQMMAEPLVYGNHHWNIVNSGYSIVGLGVIVANGQTWLTEDFAG